jgi:Tfp pilus assembly protein PilF
MTSETGLKEEAASLMGEERWAEAAELISRRPETVGEDYELAWNAGWCFFKLSQFERAVTALRRAVSLDPRNPGGHWALGAALAESGDRESAEIEYLEALRLRDGFLPRASLALLYLEMGRQADAEKVHLEGIQLKPESRERLESYGDFLWDVRREDEARQAYSKAEKLWYESRNSVA